MHQYFRGMFNDLKRKIYIDYANSEKYDMLTFRMHYSKGSHNQQILEGIVWLNWITYLFYVFEK